MTLTMEQQAAMLELENQAYEAGFQAVCGVDEAGRGPLAGPVFAAAVILPPGLIIEGLNDSKQLSEKKREELFDIIQREAVCYGIGMADHKEIDRINILQATFEAMKKAVAKLSTAPDLVLVDGNRDPGLGIETRTIVKGDAKSASIAAASILAKVSRDRFMMELDRQYPAYQFAKHKGYPTKAHYQAIRENGVSPVHRKTFLKKMH